MGKTLDFKAMQKWNEIPKDMQQRLIDNVFCVNCTVTTVVDYEIKNDKYGIKLIGKCKKCGEPVVRVIEDI